MAGETTPPGGATRFIETTRGLLSYAQLAPILAERVLEVERAIASGHFSDQPMAGQLILLFHCKICGDLVPAWSDAGVMRRCASVNITRPPPHFSNPRFGRFPFTPCSRFISDRNTI